MLTSIDSTVDTPPSVSGAASPRGASSRRTTIFIVCSPRPRVGRTMLSRLLTEYQLLNGRPVTAFDVTAEPELANYLPNATTIASINDTPGQMALFDRLIANDGVTKVVDVGRGFFDQFFAQLEEIGFVEESRLQSIDPVILFMTDMHRHSVRAYRHILERFDRVTLVPVYNEAIVGGARDNVRFPVFRSAAPMTIRSLSPFLPRLIDKPGFSFAEFLRQSNDTTSELSMWISRCFVEFRELELRLLVEAFRPIFQSTELVETQ